MWNTPTKKQLNKVPRLYETEEIPLEDKEVHLHFFVGSNDWFVVEFDGDDTFFGFACINGDKEMAEWGYFSFEELKRIRVQGCFEVDCESPEFGGWPRKVKGVEFIQECQGIF
jgi:hypothetical protein